MAVRAWETEVSLVDARACLCGCHMGQFRVKDKQTSSNEYTDRVALLDVLTVLAIAIWVHLMKWLVAVL